MRTRLLFSVVYCMLLGYEYRCWRTKTNLEYIFSVVYCILWKILNSVVCNKSMLFPSFRMHLLNSSLLISMRAFLFHQSLYFCCYIYARLNKFWYILHCRKPVLSDKSLPSLRKKLLLSIDFGLGLWDLYCFLCSPCYWNQQSVFWKCFSYSLVIIIHFTLLSFG